MRRPWADMSVLQFFQSGFASPDERDRVRSQIESTPCAQARRASGQIGAASDVQKGDN
jgi:hypothetical protein